MILMSDSPNDEQLNLNQTWKVWRKIICRDLYGDFEFFTFCTHKHGEENLRKWVIPNSTDASEKDRMEQ